jgi:hypothetical protein
MRAAVLVLASLAAALHPAASARPPLSDPYQIFANARSYWMAQRYPTQLRYTISERALVGDTPDARHYDASWYAADNVALVDPVSAEERAHPYRPSAGVPISILFIPIVNIGGPRHGTGINTDLLGVPMLAPNYSFAVAPYVPPQKKTSAQIVGEIRAMYHDPLPAARAATLPASQLPTIAVVSAGTRRYTISLVGIEPYGDHLDYHLALTPLREPRRYRLRALWIDTRTFATDKLSQDGNFTGSDATRVPWTVTFHDIGGARYIDTEREMSPLGSRDGMLHDVTISFENIVAASAAPNVAGPTPPGALYEPSDP